MERTLDGKVAAGGRGRLFQRAFLAGHHHKVVLALEIDRAGGDVEREPLCEIGSIFLFSRTTFDGE